MNPEEESAILRSKAEKKKLHLAAERFNVEGRASFKFLQSLGILPTPVTPDSLVRFFRSTPSLDRRKIGEFLGGHEPLQLSVLDKFVESFSFKDVRPSSAAAPQQPGQGSAHEVSMDDALRTFLDCFLLPGEAQQIARIIEKFSAAFFRHCPGPLATADAAYVLAYSVIMLNTDAHKSAGAEEDDQGRVHPQPARYQRRQGPARRLPVVPVRLHHVARDPHDRRPAGGRRRGRRGRLQRAQVALRTEQGQRAVPDQRAAHPRPRHVLPRVDVRRVHVRGLPGEPRAALARLVQQRARAQAAAEGAAGLLRVRPHLQRLRAQRLL